jgi:hypothetical protein
MTAAGPGTDIALALSRCGEAIALLEVVKAEFNLELACQECARLLAKWGRRDEAQSDSIGRGKTSRLWEPILR